MNKYAFFDVDNTIYNGYSTSDFCLFLANQGICSKSVIEKVEELVEFYSSGKIDYTTASIQATQLLTDALKGFTLGEVTQLGDSFVTKGAKLFPFVIELFGLLEEHGFQTYLISAAANPCIEAIARFLKTDKYFASELEIIADKYTGKILKMLNNEEKRHTIRHIMGHLSENSLKLGFGDSTGDTQMLLSVNHAFVINPHQKEIIKLAKEMKWSLGTNETILSEVRKTLNL